MTDEDRLCLGGRQAIFGVFLSVALETLCVTCFAIVYLASFVPLLL